MTPEDLQTALEAAHPKAIDFLEREMSGLDIESIAQSAGYFVRGRRFGYVIFSTKQVAAKR